MRKCEDWLKSYILFTEGQESPDLFHLWCGISAISAAFERKVWMDRGYYTLYPNLYIVLVAESAISRKSTAIGIARKMLVEAINSYPIFAQKTTTEALINALHLSCADRGTSSGLVVASELSVFLGKSAQDATLVQALTNIYDSHEDPFVYHTIGRGIQLCDHPYLCLLGGTTPDWIRTSLPQGSVGGGFTSRIVFVHADRGGKRIAFPHLSDEQREERVRLVVDLTSIGRLEGEYKLTNAAKEWFETWYVEVGDLEREDRSLSGYYGRKHDTLLKVGMVLAAGRREALVVEEKDLASALQILNANEKALPKVMKLIQSTEVGENAMMVFKVIEKRRTIKHSDLLRLFSYKLKASEISEIVQGLRDAEMIEFGTDGKARVYKVREG